MLGMFSNEQKYKILSKTGYTGSSQGDEMEAFMQSKPEARSLVQRLERKAKQMQGLPSKGPENKTIGMVEGGMVKMQQGGMVNEAELAGLAGAGYDTSKLTATGYDINKDKFDASGFIGDPRRMRQDLTFDKATGTYKPFGSGAFTTGFSSYAMPPKDGVWPTPDPNISRSREQLPGETMIEYMERMGYLETLGPDPSDIKSPEEQAAIDARIAEGPAAINAALARGQDSSSSSDDSSSGSGGGVGSMTKASAVTAPNYSYISPTADQEIAAIPEQKATTAGVQTVGTAAQAQEPTATTTATTTADTAAPAVQQATAATQAQQGEVSQEAQVQAQQQDQSAVSGMQAAQGTANIMQNPVQREIQAGELVSGAADAQKAAAFTEQIQAAQAKPSEKATVQGQLDGLMQQFEGGDKTPAWAAGAMRAATAQMAARGLGASSMAGQAVIQAAMESALPIAQADAATVAQFEAQNLSNRQQRAMLAAQQRAEFMGQEFDQAFQARVQNASRIADVANMNFTAEQQVALENSRAANTMALQNLSNNQAMVMAEAAALSNLDMANLNNRQQAAVQNAQNFLSMDMANLNNRQQTELFRAQQNIQALFTDQAAINAASQFNAASENQTNQFFADLQANVSKFNTDQRNAISQFDANATNATYQFNVAQDNAMKQFMVSNNLVVAQANAKWRQTAATLNQQAANERALYVAKEQNALTQAELDEIWQRERDEMDYVFNAYQNDQDRSNAIILQKLSAEATLDAAKLQAEIGANATIGKALFNWLF